MRQAIAFVLLWAAMAAGQTTGTQPFQHYNADSPVGIVCLSKDGTRPIACPAPPPRSVPAVRKTRKVDAISMMDQKECRKLNGMVSAEGLCSSWDEHYWTCNDPSIPGGADRALVVSENGKKAMCLLVE